MDLQAIIFDWSGTLSDDRRPVWAANVKMCLHWGIETQPFEQWVGTVTASPIEFFRSRGVTASGDEIYTLYRQCFSDALAEGVRPCAYNDSVETLGALRAAGFPIGVVSAHPHVFLEEEARGYSLAQLIDALCGDSRDKATMLPQVCATLEVEPSATLYVGDTIYDIRAARAAGLQTAGITTGYHTREVLEKEAPDYLLSNLSEMIESMKI